MQALSTIAALEIVPAPPRNEELTLAVASGMQLPVAQVETLGMFMAQTQARYPKQELPEGTPDMYLAEWEEMAVKYGLMAFRDALSRVLRNRDRPQFFPEPHEIEAYCEASFRDQSNRLRGEKAVREFDELKAQSDRERAEDERSGPREPSETEGRLNRILATARTRKERPLSSVPALRYTEAEIATWPEPIQRSYRASQAARAEGM